MLRHLPTVKRCGVVTLPFILLCIELFVTGCREPAEAIVKPRSSPNAKSKILTSDEAVAIARHAIKGKVELQRGAPVTVELKGNVFVVTFLCILPPGTRGPDYDAQLTIDAETGKVIMFMAG